VEWNVGEGDHNMGMKPAPRHIIDMIKGNIAWEPEFSPLGIESRRVIFILINKSVIDLGHEYEEFHVALGCLRTTNTLSIFLKCIKCNQFMNIIHLETDSNWKGDQYSKWKSEGLPATHACGHIQAQQTRLDEFHTEEVVKG